MPDYASAITPVEADAQVGRLNCAEPEVEIGAALARVSVAAVYLFDEFAAIGKVDSHARSQSGIAANRGGIVPAADHRRPRENRQKHMQAEKLPTGLPDV